MAEDILTKKRGVEIEPRNDVIIPTDSEKGFPLLRLTEEYYNFDDLIVSDEIKGALMHVIAENKNLKRLESFGLTPKQKILLCGPPGTGKTLSAKVISSVIGHPLAYVLFDSIISSFLGQTATNLRKIFDFIENNNYVVLFDEFDIVGKKRDDSQEHGEIKRVVNNFMQMMDNYNGDSLLVAATNHPHLLDTAIWRRFDEIIQFELPNLEQRKKLFQKYLGVLKTEELELNDLVKKTTKYSPADIASVCEDALRRNVVKGETRIKKEDVIWAVKEQKRRKDIMISKS